KKPYHGLGSLYHRIRFDPADRPADEREGVGIAVGHAHTAAHEDIEASDFFALDLSDKAEVLREDIYAVVVWNPQAGLELARQIGFAIDGLGVAFRLRQPFAVEPDFVICPRARSQMLGNAVGPELQLLAHRVEGRGARHHVALDIAASPERCQQAIVDALDRRMQIALQHAVQLNALARSETQGRVGEFAGQIVY